MSRKLRVGIIGLGMGRGHLKEYQGHDACDVVAIADPDRARLDAVGTECRIPGLYTDGRVMLEAEKLDLVSIATPNKFHAPLTLAAFKAGCHVLCEKPMAMNAAEARTMIRAARKARRRLMINFSFRFTPQSWALKQEVDNGALGDIYYGRTLWLRRRGMPRFGGWFGQKALSGGGPLIDLGVHRLDLALWLMGYPEPEWVLGATYDPIASEKARRERQKYDVEDFATAMIRFRNGATLHLEASWAGNIRAREQMETTLLGTRGGITQRNLNEGYDFEAELYTERHGRQVDLQFHPPLPGPGSAMRHFVDSIADKRPHVATGEEGLLVMRLLDAIYESARRRAPVRVR